MHIVNIQTSKHTRIYIKYKQILFAKTKRGKLWFVPGIPVLGCLIQEDGFRKKKILTVLKNGGKEIGKKPMQICKIIYDHHIKFKHGIQLGREVYTSPAFT